MADVAPKKSGFRALFTKRTNTDPSPRKRLSKKESQSPTLASDKFGLEIVANPQRQDSGSFTNQSIDLPEENGLHTYGNATSPASYGYRDSPYDAVNLVARNQPVHSYSSPQLPDVRRNSEGLRQDSGFLSKLQNVRSASVTQFTNNSTQATVERLPPSRGPSAKLSKVHRMPKPEDLLDKDTGERKDLTDMMHAFTFNEVLDTVEEKVYEESLDYDPSKPDGTGMLGNTSPEVWLRVADFLTPLDVANLASTCRTMYTRLGRHPHKLLLDPTNRPHRLNFLLAMDHKLPRHLFCFPCAQWHLRIQPGFEKLKPHHVLNPLFECPNRTNIHRPPPRIRISDGRMLPFAFVQLARRSWAFGPDFGIGHQTLARRWKDPYSDWTHETMYNVTDKGHVMMRVKSQCYVEGGMTAAAKRMLLFSRDNYTPYFSVCSHWKDGILTSIPKCVLDHIPFVPPSEVYAVDHLREKVHGKRALGLVNLCSRCRPMRRCPECPTEYLFELKLVEDKTVKSTSPDRFRQALIATRWSDLGPGRSPESDREWAAIAGEYDQYDSFLEIGRRAVSGIFESAFTDVVPGHRILSMNPKKVKADEIGGDWY